MVNYPLIKAVLFDFDGTLTKPGVLDFPAFKRLLSCPSHRPVLEFIQEIPDDLDRERAILLLDDFEINAAEKSGPNLGAEDIIRYLRDKELLLGIISRNSLKSILRALENFQTVQALDFEIIISRDDPIKPKPSVDGIFLAAQRLKVRTEEILVVGDYVFDIEAGFKAGARTAYLNNLNRPLPEELQSDFIISNLGELKEIIPSLSIPVDFIPQ